jgi:tetratricopeptide (TPR) repeat protein
MPEPSPSEPRLVPPLRVFLSYSHNDEKLCEKFLVHLSQLTRDGLIEPWNDRRITAGSEWANEIDEHLKSAHVIILLVSADFLNSDYCNDIEMKCALDRSQKGEARVVSVILRPCDWETSRFAKLQALPQGGKPVVDWKTLDHGFLDVVKGLRRSIVELCGPGPVRAQVLQTKIRRHPWRWASGLVLAALLLACLWLWSNSRRYLKQGTDLLNVGWYPAARQPLRQARRLNPLSGKAGCGLEAIELDAIRYDRTRFEQRLNEANRQYPNCAYLKVLTGDQKYRAGDRQGAFADYQEAVKREPQLAEAYFDMGRILELDGDLDSALPQYQKAAQLSPGTSRYHNNLGDLYFRIGDYDKAIEEYGQVSNYPLSALEAARIYRLQAKLEDARGREEDAIRWLQEPPVQVAETQNAWAFDVSPTQQVRLALLPEKQSYAELELAVTAFLQGNEAEAARLIPAAFERASSRRHELNDILRWELHRLGSEVPGYTQRTDEFAGKFLKSSNPDE